MGPPILSPSRFLSILCATIRTVRRTACSHRAFSRTVWCQIFLAHRCVFHDRHIHRNEPLLHGRAVNQGLFGIFSFRLISESSTKALIEALGGPTKPGNRQAFRQSGPAACSLISRITLSISRRGNRRAKQKRRNQHFQLFCIFSIMFLFYQNIPGFSSVPFSTPRPTGVKPLADRDIEVDDNRLVRCGHLDTAGSPSPSKTIRGSFLSLFGPNRTIATLPSILSAFAYPRFA